MDKKYYLPISAKSLAHYFGCACIKPSKFFSNKQEDLQDKFKDFLLITNHFGTQQTDCCLEIVLTKEEINDYLINVKNGFFLLDRPLPITRIKKIYFSDNELKELTITNINMSTAFVPENLIEIVKAFEKPQIDQIQKPQEAEALDYTEKLKSYDRFLGAFVLLRLAGEEYMNYSENYFATLAFFNSKIQRDLEDSRVKIDIRYRGLFNGENGFKSLIPYLTKTVDENDVNTIAQIENQEVKKNKTTRVIEIDSLDKLTYTVAVLNTYGLEKESRRKKIADLILSNFKSEIKEGKAEGIALCYGFNRGYSVFSNKYSLNSIEKIVKFQLNSQLDYYTIESLFQYAFNGTKSNEFEYLDWCPKQKWSKLNKKTDYKILDTIVIGKKKAKVLSKEYWAELLPSFSQSSKFFEKNLSQMFQELGEVIYNDTRSECDDEFESKIAFEQKEKEKLRKDLYAERERIEELLKNKISLDESVSKEEETQSIITEQISIQNPQPDIKSLVKEVLKYKGKTQKMLKSEAMQKGIDLPVNIKQDEIIVLLMTTKGKDLFNG